MSRVASKCKQEIWSFSNNIGAHLPVSTIGRLSSYQ